MTQTPEKGAEAVQTVQFPSAFNLFMPSIKALWRNIFTILEGMALVGIVLCVAVLAGILSGVGSDVMRVVMIVLMAAISLISLALIVVFAAGYTVLQLKSVRGHKVGLKEAFNDGKRFALRLLGLSALLTLVFIVAFLLLVVPLVFALKRYYLAPYFMVDRNLGIMASMKASAEASKRFSGAMWGLIGVEMLISLVGFIPLAGVVFGTLADLLYSFAPAVRYQQMKEVAEHGKVITAADPAPAAA